MLSALHDRTGRLEMIYFAGFTWVGLHDRTGRLEIFAKRVASCLFLHDRTGRLENIPIANTTVILPSRPHRSLRKSKYTNHRP